MKVNYFRLSAEIAEQLLEGEPFHGSIRLEGLLDAATLRGVLSGEPLNPWPHLAKVIPYLKGRSLNQLGRYGNMLHFHLFYTLCTQPPAPSSNDGWPVLPHDEPVFEWIEYTRRDEEMQDLWSLFDQAAPEALTHSIKMQGSTRAISLSPESREHITGFITAEEAQYLLERVRTRERPWLYSILSGLIRDGVSKVWEIDLNLPISEPGLSALQAENNERSKEAQLLSWMYKGYEGHEADFQIIADYWMKTHPEEMGAFQERYYQDLWQVEEEILQRMRLALARGWGMLKTSSS